MPSRDANGNWVYSQAEYEHLNFTGEPFSGFVEGIGYTCPEIIVTSRPFNASGTHFMCDISLIGYTFDMNEIAYNEVTISSKIQNKEEKSKPDRSEYARIPTVSKFKYQEDWYNPLNVATFADNVFLDLINPLIDIVNTLIVTSPQVVYHEGFGALGSEILDGIGQAIKTPYYLANDTYDYLSNTPFSQQISDLEGDLSNPHNWEKGVAMGIGVFYGGRGMIPKAQTKLRSVPSGASPIPKLDYPVETTSDRFLFRGFNIKSPINLPAQRFGQLGLKYTDYWGIKTGSSKFLTRRIYAIKPDWNDLTQYTTGIIPKGTSIKIGIVGPQSPFYKYPGGSIQIRVMSKNVIKQTSIIVN